MAPSLCVAHVTPAGRASTQTPGVSVELGRAPCQAVTRTSRGWGWRRGSCISEPPRAQVPSALPSLPRLCHMPGPWSRARLSGLEACFTRDKRHDLVVCWLWTKTDTTEPPGGPGISTTAGGSPVPRSGQCPPTGHLLWILLPCHLWPCGRAVRESRVLRATCDDRLQLLLRRSMCLCNYPAMAPRSYPVFTP